MAERNQGYLGYLEELARQTGVLHQAIESDDWEGLAARLQTRQTLIDQIERLPPDARRLSEPNRVRAAELLEQILEYHQRDTVVLNLAMNETRGALNENEKARATLSAYRRNLPSTRDLGARFLDTQR